MNSYSLFGTNVHIQLSELLTSALAERDSCWQEPEDETISQVVLIPGSNVKWYSTSYARMNTIDS